MTGGRDPFDWLMSQRTPEEREAAAANREMNEDAAQAAREEARLFADVFNTGRGPELLYLLRNRTIEVGLMEVTRSTVRGEVALSPADWAYVREGQNSVIRMIEEQVRIALIPEPPRAVEPANSEG